MIKFFICVWCACAVTVTSSGEIPSWRNTQTLRRANCTTCEENLQRHVQEVLPRLSLIKQRILNAIGRNPVTSSAKTSNIIEPFQSEEDTLHLLQTVKTERPHEYRLNEIISYSKPKKQDTNNDVLNFSLNSRNRIDKEIAVAASLLIYVDRRRKIRKGGKGKRILIEISKLINDNTWQILSILRTKVKKRRWKRISLPVNAAQQVLDSQQQSFDLRIRCIGCGRLVQVVLDKYSSFGDKKSIKPKKSNNQKAWKEYERDKRSKRNRRHRDRKRNSGSPILVINTRVPL